jgi:hypothetical protein
MFWFRFACVFRNTFIDDTALGPAARVPPYPLSSTPVQLSAADYEASLGAGIYSSTRDEGTVSSSRKVHRNVAYIVELMESYM